MKCLSLIAATMAATFGLSVAGSAAQTVDLTYGSYYPPQHLIHVDGIEPANKELKGKIYFQIVPGGQLWSASTALKGIGTGVADAGSIVNSYTRSQLKHAVLTTDLSFIVSNPLVANGAALETYFLNCPECLADFRQNGTVFLAGATSAGYSLMCRDDVKSLADVKGKKIRTAGAMGRLAKAMGGTAVSMSTSDMVEALSRGQIDCIMGPLAWLKSYPISDIVRSVFNFDIGAFNSVAVLLMNRGSWEKLSADNKKALWQAAPGMGSRATITGYIGESLDALALAKKQNITFTGPSEETRQLAKKHRANEIQAVIKEAKKIGTSNPEKIVQAFVDNLAKWEKIIHDAGLDNVTGSPTTKREALAHAVPIYTELLREHIYDKVDYTKF